MSTEQTQGSLTKEAIRLAWPAVCESFFIALAGMVDTFMVSTLGANAVAAVGLTTQPKFLGLALFIAANVAISALVARRFGEKRQQAANEILVMTICFCIVAAVIISALTVGFADQIIEFCGSSEDTHAMAARYYRIIMGGMIFNVLSMGINAAQRGAGNTMIALRTNLISNLVNICGNYLLINGLRIPGTGDHRSRHCHGIRYGSGMRDEHRLNLSERRIYQYSVHDRASHQTAIRTAVGDYQSRLFRVY